MHIHLIGVCGTGMGSLGGLLKASGHHVTGSDTGFYPPMSDALDGWGVSTMPGWNPDNLDPRPDLVVVGNVCRRDNPEARAAIDGGMQYTSFPQAMEEMYLANRPAFVVAGTHGKTTTTTLLSYLLHRAGKDPGFLVGGVPRDFEESFCVGGDDAPFVIEGDEYDSAFFEKKPKFWRYHPWGAILTTLEHDHIDIYPDMDSYRAAFHGFVDRIDPDGLLVAFAGDPEVRRVASRAACRVVWYALDGDDCGEVTPTWQAAMVAPQSGAQPLDTFVGGTSIGRVLSPLFGAHNARNVLGAMALATEGGGAALPTLTHALRNFRGVRRRQEPLGVVNGVRLYDDFAHHPTAVRETLRGMRARHPHGNLIAVFEPRSATASRNLHQQQYPDAFREADLAILAPVGRPEISVSERLDVGAIARAIQTRGGRAKAPDSIDAIVRFVTSVATPGDTIVLMSNGAFFGIHDKLLLALTERHLVAKRLGHNP